MNTFKAACGHTLIEAVLSLALAGLIAAGLFGGLRSMASRWQSREAAMTALEILHRARWLALSEGREYAVSFSRTSPSGPWLASLMRRDGEWGAASAPQPLPGAVTQVAVLGPELKEFNPDGTSSGGSVRISCRDGRAWRITLTPATGRLRLHRES